MPTFANGESAASVRTKINDAIDKVDGNAAITSVNIDGGTIDGTTIGGSSPAVGTFTTANATTVDTTNLEVTTLKAKDGTSAGSIADSTGVVTLASSVLTTTDINGGSIDGTTIGAASAAAGTFTTVTASGDVTIADKIVHDGDTNTAIRFPAADTVTVETSGAERLRVTSAGDVGIGITPSYDLHVKQGGDSYVFGLESDGDDSRLLVGEISSTWRIAATYGSTGSFMPITFFTSDTERLRIDASGNLGLGVTPSAWGSGAAARALQLPDGNLWSFSGGVTVGQNYFYNSGGGRTYIASAQATEYYQTAGQHVWRIAPSGTAGNAITFTQAMTLSAAGGLSIGTTTDAGAGNLRVNGGALIGDGTAAAPTITFGNESNTGIFRAGASVLGFTTAGTERARIDASGNLLIGGTTAGTASAGNLVLVNGTAPTGNVTNGITLFAEDVSSSSELKVRDEAGNVTTLSPHNFDLIPEGPSEEMAWSYYSERDGKRINVDMLKAIRLLEQITGEKLVHIV